ncbi:hypothetical protein PTE30175_00257 [Pandoraea terrae]|uniref:Uncharacterized protein n=1 Tax=Pandoraea terrae TaxID=1537710 RepID=A0A5E4RM83_9BURK|nr:hypothetical protein [Pandoraea terrae]VVD64225.1 hypothetical protein PTE30175_00257 [Pandoraea terrae]
MHHTKAFRLWAGPDSTRVLLGVLGAVMASIPGVARAACYCEFPSGTETMAYGTRAACTIVMSEANKTCNIAFAATGADPGIATMMAPTRGEDYATEAYSISIEYLTYIRDRNIDKLTNPEYIKKTLPALMRAGYLRRNMPAELKELDASVLEFAQTQSKQIGAVFQGKMPEYKGERKKLEYHVSRTAVQLIFDRKIKITTIFMPEPR